MMLFIKDPGHTDMAVILVSQPGCWGKVCSAAGVCGQGWIPVPASSGDFFLIWTVVHKQLDEVHQTNVASSQ